MTAEFNDDRTAVMVCQEIKDTNIDENKIIPILIQWVKNHIDIIYRMIITKYSYQGKNRFKLSLFDINMKLTHGYYVVQYLSMNKEKKEIQFMIRFII